MNGESWLYVDSELVHLWDYFADKEAMLTNTEMLFWGAARPYFNFFLPRINHLSFQEGVKIELAGDLEWRGQLEESRARESSLESLRAETARLDPARTVLITARNRGLVGVPRLKNVPVIKIDPRAGLLNIEPAWRELRLSLNKKLFDTVLVSLGPERAIIIPRLAQVYGVRAIDVSVISKILELKKPNILGRIHGKIKRTLKRC